MTKWIFKPLKHGGFFARCPYCGQTAKVETKAQYTCSNCKALVSEALYKLGRQIAKDFARIF